ncbi:2-hydroxyisoflavanone dehydratase, partial [Mucuna pruriens]
MPSTDPKEIVTEIPSWIRVFSDGTVERPLDFPIVPATLHDSYTGVSSKDIVISNTPPKPISARIYLPKITKSETQKLAVYVYFHGGGFFFESAFSKLFHHHFLKLVPLANAIVVSVEYRLAPEHPLPAGYDDCWDALKWVASHSTKDPTLTHTHTEPWLIDHGDFNRVFIGGDSAGANIVHNILAFRNGPEALPGDVKIVGAILAHPYFYGSEPVGSEPVTGLDQNFFNVVWRLVYPSAPGGIDNPFINPLGPGAPSLARLACSRIFVCVAGKDGLRDRGIWYYEAVKKSGWEGEIQLFEEKEEDHDYHLLKPALDQDSPSAHKLITLMASFLLNDGTVERPRQTPFVPPSIDDPRTRVSSKDVVISHNPPISARLYLPQLTPTNDVTFPILVYFHGGGFFFESAFSQLYHHHFNAFVSQTNCIVVSVEYRLAPEHPLPAGYHDCWDALKWVASQSSNNADPWLIHHGNFNRIFIGGDSAGGNIVHNIAMRAGTEPLPCGVKLLGAIFSHPYFFSSSPIGREAVTGHEQSLPYLVWNFVYPSAPGGVDNPMLNPVAPGAPSLDGLGCSKVIVCVASQDNLRDRGVWYYEAVKESGWPGELELFEQSGEDHVYHIFHPESENGIKLIKLLALFLHR